MPDQVPQTPRTTASKVSIASPQVAQSPIFVPDAELFGEGHNIFAWFIQMNLFSKIQFISNKLWERRKETQIKIAIQHEKGEANK